MCVSGPALSVCSLANLLNAADVINGMELAENVRHVERPSCLSAGPRGASLDLALRAAADLRAACKAAGSHSPGRGLIGIGILTHRGSVWGLSRWLGRLLGAVARRGRGRCGRV
jgi:hypothetical protein